MTPCDSCHAGCCRSFAVPVTGADIIRIEQGLKLSFWDFVCRWADPEGQIARNYAPQFHFRDEPGTPFTICLIHEESRFFEDTTKCRFLTEGQPDAEQPYGVARCGIYRYRPSACRAFPTKLDSTGELAVIHSIPGRSRVSPDESSAVYDLCPEPWDVAHFDPIQTVDDLVVAKYEMNFFRRLADAWNRKPRQWSLFPDFLRAVYTSRIDHETSVESEHPTSPRTITLSNTAARSSMRAA